MSSYLETNTNKPQKSLYGVFLISFLRNDTKNTLYTCQGLNSTQILFWKVTLSNAEILGVHNYYNYKY